MDGGYALEDSIVGRTRSWVDSFVVGLGLCPFARHELIRDRVRFHVCEAGSALDLIPVLEAELERLSTDEDIGTTLLIHPRALTAFDAYLDFLEIANQIVNEMGLEGIIQIASFHPDYQFEGTTADDVSNMTNRSPYPMLHLIREEDITRAVESHPDIEGIPAANIARLRALGKEAIKALIGPA